MVKCLPTMWETRIRSLGWEDPLEKEMVTHSSTLAWKILRTESLVVYNSWGHKESDTTERFKKIKLSNWELIYQNINGLFFICILVLYSVLVSGKWQCKKLKCIMSDRENKSTIIPG